MRSAQARAPVTDISVSVYSKRTGTSTGTSTSIGEHLHHWYQVQLYLVSGTTPVPFLTVKTCQGSRTHDFLDTKGLARLLRFIA